MDDLGVPLSSETPIYIHLEYLFWSTFFLKSLIQEVAARLASAEASVSGIEVFVGSVLMRGKPLHVWDVYTTKTCLNGNSD